VLEKVMRMDTLMDITIIEATIMDITILIDMVITITIIEDLILHHRAGIMVKRGWHGHGTPPGLRK
jgi:hypothetical protein